MSKNSYSAPSVTKAFEILKALGGSSGGLGISSLARTLGIGKSTVHGIMAAMEDLGVVIRDESTKRYLAHIGKQVPYLPYRYWI